jgi:branched-chain amino acid transport system substrate-binding protein
VTGLLGPTLSAQALAADPIAQKNGIPLIAISNTVPQITEMGDFIFRCSLPESFVISGTVKAAAENLKTKKIGILYGREDTYTMAGYQAFADAIKEQGIQTVAEETFLRGDMNFKAQLSRIISQKPDAIAVSAYVTEASLITIQARDLGYVGIILGSNGFNSADFIKKAGAAAEGIVVGTAWNMANDFPANTRFVSNFQKVYNILPDQFAAQSYTGVHIFASAIRLANSSDSRLIQQALSKIGSLESPLGLFSFTAGREPVYTASVQIVREGKFVGLNP